jgi:hypothetical protein
MAEIARAEIPRHPKRLESGTNPKPMGFLKYAVVFRRELVLNVLKHPGFAPFRPMYQCLNNVRL